jgi:hypothetical protein
MALIGIVDCMKQEEKKKKKMRRDASITENELEFA